MSSLVMRPLCDALERIGLAPRPVLASVGVTQAQLKDPDGQVSCRAYLTMVEWAQRERPQESIPLRLAEATPIGAHALLDYLILSSDTVGDGLRRLSRYYRLVGAPEPIEIDEGEHSIRVDIGARGVPFVSEYVVALNLLHLRRESEGRALAQWASLDHRPGDPAEYERALKCPLRVNATWNGFALSPEVWKVPMRRSDPTLIRLLEPHADAAVGGQASQETLRARVRRAQAHGLAAGDASVGAIARALAISARTLQRRLTEEGASFQQLLDEVRREMAERHLSDSALPIGEISFLLGYSEPAAFHRAFRRWRGITAQAYRAERRE